ncbi:MAG: DUF192 domain-containing protein [Balneolaceae bacterium]|nr:DUF192 domain-containing protein [Balneolaceae bacterium]MBO6546497.1 DUF192 domain-containing protein [Balneolaceae bacterium]MBO6648856.1 DUF192 domain-containing protein [Balneolaceae bacterium]
MRLNSRLNKVLLIIVSGFFITNCSSEKTEPANNNQPKGRIVTPESELTFLNKSGQEITNLSISIADLPDERNQGLMDVRTMPQDVGMLFIFDGEAPRSFWMANTPLPLDIMYVNSDSVIVRIYQNTTPFSETSLPSEAPAQFVVETNGGFSLTHGITEGMKIRF